MGILACQQGPLLGRELGGGASSLRARSLAAGFFFFLGGGGGGRGSKRPCSQARTGEGFASQHNVFFLSFLP